MAGEFGLIDKYFARPTPSAVLGPGDDCALLAGEGSRIRLCKGAYAEPAEVAHRSKSAIDRNYKRCATILLEGAGRPLFATHDDAMIEHVRSTANRVDRSQSSYELQMLLGIRSEEQRRLAGRDRRGEGAPRRARRHLGPHRPRRSALHAVRQVCAVFAPDTCTGNQQGKSKQVVGWSRSKRHHLHHDVQV